MNLSRNRALWRRRRCFITPTPTSNYRNLKICRSSLRMSRCKRQSGHLGVHFFLAAFTLFSLGRNRWIAKHSKREIALLFRVRKTSTLVAFRNHFLLKWSLGLDPFPLERPTYKHRLPAQNT